MKPLINDFSIQVATVNGSGSQSANMVLMRSIFQMGIPVSGKNLFPSNIAGLPTWFTIRVSKEGYIARRVRSEVFVAMNPTTADEDVAALEAGSLLVFNDAIKPASIPEGIHAYPVPFTKLVGKITQNMKLRKLLTNMIYVGVLGELLGIPDDEVNEALGKQFVGKPKAVESNQQAVAVGREHVRENPIADLPYRLERMNQTKGKIIIDGNTAAAIGSMFAGVTVVAWYPITPSSSLCEAAIDYLGRYRHDPVTGKATYAVVQAEDELASVGVVLGASWAGARAMTATAGPGISLMSEFVGLGYFAEIPAVIWDIQRMGPSTGLPTRTSQGDVAKVVNLSHGDTKHIVLFPASVEDCYWMAMEAFDLAEEFQTPVFVLSDLEIGMNNWMADPFPYPDRPIRRGKILSKEDLDRVGVFARYRDVDGDGIPYRTLPGTDHPLAPFFTRGSGHTENAQYTEKADDYQNLLERLARKYETARSRVPAPVVEKETGAKIGIIAYGSTHHAIVEARDQMRDQGVKTSYLRLQALPLNGEVEDFIGKHERVYVVEQNRDAQMADQIRLHVNGHSSKVRSVLHYNGLPVDAQFVTDHILAAERKG